MTNKETVDLDPRALLEGATSGERHATNHFDDDTTPCNCAYVLSEGYVGSICSVSVSNNIASIADGGNDCPPRKEAAANALLIAAAPQLALTCISQEERIAELQEALTAFVYETTHLSPCRTDGSHDCRIPAQTLSRARAALTNTGEPA